ncbi:SDR family NAD(P)-dependent oxidoreductase [Paenibacillus sp. P26]|nr:SDR family NAD(P)-dependent oxidoreductase [Paenibacillus sp. P26]
MVHYRNFQRFRPAIRRAVLATEDKIVATARSLEAIADFKERAPERVHIAALDVTNKEQIQSAVDEAVKAFGSIDIVVNNAGYGLSGMLEEYTDEQMKEQWEVNVFGVLNVIRATLPVLKKQRSGHYINFSSILGVMTVPSLSLYSATKFAVEGFSEAMAAELAGFGIKTTIVEPGVFATDFSGRSMRRAEPREEYAAVHEAVAQSFAELKAGDPAKAVKAVMEMVNSANPPLHFPVGPDASYGIRDTFAKRIEEIAAWEKLAVDTAFDS